MHYNSMLLLITIFLTGCSKRDIHIPPVEPPVENRLDSGNRAYKIWRSMVNSDRSKKALFNDYYEQMEWNAALVKYRFDKLLSRLGAIDANVTLLDLDAVLVTKDFDNFKQVINSLRDIVKSKMTFQQREETLHVLVPYELIEYGSFPLIQNYFSCFRFYNIKLEKTKQESGGLCRTLFAYLDHQERDIVTAILL